MMDASYSDSDDSNNLSGSENKKFNKTQTKSKSATARKIKNSGSSYQDKPATNSPRSTRASRKLTTKPKATKVNNSSSPRSKRVTKDPSGLEIISDKGKVASNLPKYRSESEEDIIPVPKTKYLARSKSPRKAARPSSPRNANKVLVPPPPGSKKKLSDPNQKKEKAAAKIKQFGQKVDTFLTEDVGKPVSNAFGELANKIKNNEEGVVAGSTTETIEVAKQALVALGAPSNKVSKEKVLGESKENKVLENLRSFVKDNEGKNTQEDNSEEFEQEKVSLSPRKSEEEIIEETPRTFREDITEEPQLSNRQRTSRRSEKTLSNQDNLSRPIESRNTRISRPVEPQNNTIKKSKKPSARLASGTDPKAKLLELNNKIKEVLLPGFVDKFPDTDNLLELTWANSWAIKAVDDVYSRVKEMPDEVIKDEGGYVSWKNVKGFDEIKVSDKLSIDLYPVPHLDLITGYYSKSLNIPKDYEEDLSGDVGQNNEITVISTNSWTRLIALLSTLITISTLINSDKSVSLFKASRILESRVDEADNSDKILSLLEDYVENS